MSELARTEASLRFENVTLGYDGHPAVHHLDGVIAPSSLTAVVGPNGSGKTSLLKGIVGQLAPLEGRIRIEGVDPRRIAYLPQQASIDRTFPMTVFELIALGAWPRIGAFGALDAEEHGRIARAISAVGLEGFERRTIDALSGGQLQRCLFARVLVQDSPLVLLDEPFSAIDARTAKDLMALIDRWHGERRTVIAVLHDLDLVKERFPQALLLARDVVAWGSTGSVVTAANLLKARAMSERWDERADWCERAPAKT
jgi:zinc/manganese transport system ATP-binding protein